VTAGSQESGLLVVDKPAGITSHDVVSRVRRLARTRRVGHAGTLDPMATGVLIVGVNRATRLLGHLALTEKRYDATVRLGEVRSTDDAAGELLGRASAGDLGEDAVRAAAATFVGAIDQVPSAVSAVKVDGRRAYQRVRAGETVVIAARRVTVHELTVHDAMPVDGADPALLDVRISVRCSSGTYVRAIARDLGAALGVGGHLTALRRTAIGPVGLDEATPLAAMEEAGSVPLLPMDAAVPRFFRTCRIDEEVTRAVSFGRPVELPAADQVGAGSAPVALLGPDGRFLALYDAAQPVARPVAVFV
jgi:tRNA pseudouridine55 synthase